MTLWWFSQISLVSPLANAIAIPIISFIVTPLAMLGVVLPWWLGDTCLWLSHQAFWVVAWFLKPMAEWEWAVIHGAKPWGWMLVIALIGVALSIRPGPLIHAWKSRLFGTCICLSLLIPRQWLFGNGIAHGEFEMLVWDIGQGSAVLIKTKEHHLLYDLMVHYLHGVLVQMVS
jgi:competence protein ComEC